MMEQLAVRPPLEMRVAAKRVLQYRASTPQGRHAMPRSIQYITHIACEPGSASRSVVFQLPDFQALAVGSRHR